MPISLNIRRWYRPAGPCFVFSDAHSTPGIDVKTDEEKILVYCYRRDETADEFIERFSRSIKARTAPFMWQRPIIWSNGWFSDKGPFTSLPGAVGGDPDRKREIKQKIETEENREQKTKETPWKKK